MPRHRIWSFVHDNFPCLEVLARDIAHGGSAPTALPGYPPLNYLTNGESPASAPLGLAGLFVGSPPFSIARPLAPPLPPKLQPCKRGNLDGFHAVSPVGLSVLFGTWTDFCLNCWAQHPTAHAGSEGPILILAPDHGPLDDPLAPVLPGVDWGVTELNRFYHSTDRSTVNLFGAIASAAGTTARSGCVFNGGQQQALEQFIARRRILVFNVWPWFRSGTGATASASIHSNLASVLTIPLWVSDLVQCLNPERIGTLGDWAYDSPAALKGAIASHAPSWFIREFLSGTKFSRQAAHQPEIRQFYHPSYTPSWKGGRPAWFSVTPGYSPTLKNEQAFVDFLR